MLSLGTRLCFEECCDLGRRVTLCFAVILYFVLHCLGIYLGVEEYCNGIEGSRVFLCHFDILGSFIEM